MESLLSVHPHTKHRQIDQVDIFQTNDLSEKRDMGSVTNTMFALGRAVSEF